MSKTFLNEILKAKGEVVYSKRHGKEVQSGGRRTDEARNVYWASVVSHVPRDVFRTRQGRATMRLLGAPYRTIKEAAAIRGRLEDSAKGWCYIKTAQHSDRVDQDIYREAWHSEQLSTEDNVHKELTTVFCDACTAADGTTTQNYTRHWRRAQLGTDKDCFAAFLASEYATKLAESTKTEKLPAGRKGNLDDFVRAKCACIKKRGTAECDCKICSIFEKNLQVWHSRRHGWRNSLRRVRVDGEFVLKRPEPCTCWICSNETRRGQYYEFSRSVYHAMRILHPCGKLEYEPYKLGESKFFYYNGLCVSGKCPCRSIGSNPWSLSTSIETASCGWDFVFGKTDCPLEATTDSYTWYEWRQQLRGKTSDGKPYYSEEPVPITGTRADGLKVLRQQAAVYSRTSGSTSCCSAASRASRPTRTT
jgi:hypothetical protein